jgi:hypothetical protein
MPERKSTSSRGNRRAAGGASRARSSPGAEHRSPRSTADAPGPEDLTAAALEAFREALLASVLTPLNLVILSHERIQEAVDEAVERGRMTRDDAAELVQGLVRQGREQTNHLLADLEQLMGRGRAGLTGAAPAFPIPGYDELTAAQVTARLADLTPAQLRKVRDYERRHGNRKVVLGAIERELR